MTITCLDIAEGLELWQADGGDLFVNLEDDPSIGASIIFALHEGVIEGDLNGFVELTGRQLDQVEDWLVEYDR